MSDLLTPRLRRRWYPFELAQDEILPDWEATPQAWLRPGAGSATIVRDDDDVIILTIMPGEKVAFLYVENRGSTEITVMPDGTWKGAGERDLATIDMFEGPPPERPAPDASDAARIAAANLFFWSDDNEMSGGTMDEFAREWADMDPPGADGELVEVDMYFWSDRIWFEVSADGANLTPCDAPEVELIDTVAT